VSAADQVRGWHDRLVEARGKLTEVSGFVAGDQSTDVFLAATVEIDRVSEELFDRWQDLLREEVLARPLPREPFVSAMTTDDDRVFIEELRKLLVERGGCLDAFAKGYGIVVVKAELRGRGVQEFVRKDDTPLSVVGRMMEESARAP
jgi:hypothetical protein